MRINYLFNNTERLIISNNTIHLTTVQSFLEAEDGHHSFLKVISIYETL